MYAFILILVILGVVYATTNQSLEGFRNDSSLHIPTKPYGMPDTCPKGTSITPVSNLDRSFNAAKVMPYSMPGDLPVAGYQQIGAMSPLPYQDTTLIKANRQQLISLLELVKGFLAFEAQELSEKSDPSIQLPLQTARSDFQVLQREVEVQNRNPGIQSTITLTNLNEMSSNLAYLQQQVRLIGAAGSLQGPINQFTEGFTTTTVSVPAPTTTTTTATTVSVPLTGSTAIPVTTATPATSATTATPATATAIAAPATMEDLKKLLSNVQGQINKLSASGTNDPVTKQRISGLTGIQSYVKEIIHQLTTGTLFPSDVPIMKSDIDRAFKVVSTPNSSISDALAILGIATGLQGNSKAMSQLNTLVNKYADQIINGVSATFQVKYTSPNELGLARASKAVSSIDKTGFPSMADLNNVSNAKFMPVDSGAPVTDRLAALPMDAGRGKGPAHFDWKQRAKEIEDQVKKRGLNPADFGITPIKTASPEFSWKGYARMICTRLQATMDPALPVTCGCPPMDWRGWR
jgi:hypothetical protein